MILICLILSVILFAFSCIFSTKTIQMVFAFLFGGIFVASLILLIANSSYHFGMEQTVETKTSTLVSSTDNAGADLLLYQPLGNGKETVYLYRTNTSQKKPSQTGTDQVKNSVIKNAAKAKYVRKTTRWVYKNKYYKFLFNISNNNHEYVRQQNIFYTPQNWVTLTTAQAKKLAKLVKENKETIETDAKAFVQEKMGELLKQDPTMDEAAQQAMIKKLSAEYQQESLTKLLAEVKK